MAIFPETKRVRKRAEWSWLPFIDGDIRKQFTADDLKTQLQRYNKVPTTYV